MNELDELLSQQEWRMAAIKRALTDERQAAAAEHAQACLLLKKLATAASVFLTNPKTAGARTALTDAVSDASDYLAHSGRQNAGGTAIEAQISVR